VVATANEDAVAEVHVPVVATGNEDAVAEVYVAAATLGQRCRGTRFGLYTRPLVFGCNIQSIINIIALDCMLTAGGVSTIL